MGTEKYPKENDYYSYLSEHSGNANAWTANESTNYYFEIGHQWLEGALDRFSHFFIDPLFSDSCTEREIRAVDSEHKKNLQSDCWRIDQVQKTLSNPNHPWHKFQTGSLETLMDTPKSLGLNIRDELLKFHKKYYSANIMKLCVLGQEPLDQLTQWVVEKFSEVQNKNIQVPTFPGHPLTENELMKQIFVKSVKHNRILEINFPFPDQSRYYESQPAHYLSHLIGHEGTGSILSYLKKKGWATYLSSGCGSSRGYSIFQTSIDLTKQGLEHYEDVIIAFFQYVDMLKKQGVQKWIFDEVQSLAEIEFRFSEKETPSQYTSYMVQNMQSEYPSHITISGCELLRKYDPELIEQHLDLLNINNFRITLSSQDFPNGIQCSKIEKWYKTEYDVMDISNGLKKRLSNLSNSTEFALPVRNEFIPEKLDVEKLKVDQRQTKPSLVQETSTLRLWYKKDDTFWLPKSQVWIILRNPLTHATPRYSVITELYIRMLTESLNEYTYNAEVAGLTYYISLEQYGIMLNVGGYSDKLPLLLEKLVDRMKHIQFDQEKFNMIKEQTIRDYSNFSLEAPFQHAAYYLTYTLKEHMWKYDDLSSELKDIQLEEVKANYGLFLSRLHVEALVHGNLTQDEAIQMFKMVETKLEVHPLMASQLISNRTVTLPLGNKYVYQMPVNDPEDVNSAIEFYCQVCSVTDVQLRTRLSLIAQIAQEPCFNQLRTREQLGYIVFSGVRRHIGIMGLRFIIQSEKDTIYLENRIMEFLETTLRNILLEIKDSEFQSQVQSLIADKKEKANNMGQEGSKYWSEIESGYYEFDEVDKDVEELLTITKDSLIAFYDQYINPGSSEFSKISVHMQSQKVQVVATTTTSSTSNGFDLESSLQSCLTYLQHDDGGLLEKHLNNNTTALSPDGLKQAIEKYSLEGLSPELILRKILVDEIKTKEEDVEVLLSKIASSKKAPSSSLSSSSEENEMKSSLNGSNHDNETESHYRDHTALPEGTIIINDLIKFKHQMPLSSAAVPFFLFSRI
ncbi:unnamed protein product [Cunninghamella blakesleeana]